MINPVFRKETRVMFRGWKIFYAIAVYVLILTVVANVVLNNSVLNNYNGFDPRDIMYVYFFLLGFQLVLLTFIVPSFTGGAISGERERQTLDLILITKMSAKSIIWGKLLSSMTIVLLMIAASMPTYAIIFYYGGVSFVGFILNIVYTLVYSMFLGSIAIFFSTVLKKTGLAMALSYVAVFLLTVGTVILMLIIASTYNYNDISLIRGGIACMLMLINPAFGFASIIDEHMGSDMTWGLISEFLDGNNWDFAPFHVWHIIMCVMIVISILLLRLSSNKINPIKGHKKVI